MLFWSFIFRETYIFYRGYFNLNCYIGKKVQKNFLVGLKIWLCWGPGKTIKIAAGKTVLIFHAKLQVLHWFLLFLE